MTEKEKAIQLGYEGGVFVNINLRCNFGKSWLAEKRHYAVVDGIVYEVGGGKRNPTGDGLHNINASCKRIGRYDPQKNYNDIINVEFNYRQIKKLLRL